MRVCVRPVSCKHTSICSFNVHCVVCLTQVDKMRMRRNRGGGMGGGGGGIEEEEVWEEKEDEGVCATSLMQAY